ncbi:MobH family relaxase [Nitrosomonas aestuarii]|uniref:MobH family relaxase n=1 Tax=Nitrosomonas aestuarii TaxID=52441 RepID=UPI00147FD76D|nr:MobH family relaxase [Nitrosomonas aestuarii]
MFQFFRRKKPVINTADLVTQWQGEDIPRYPPFMKGLPVVPPQFLLNTQNVLIERILQTAVCTPDIINHHYLPVINRFVQFVHLLPASQSHHHRGAGGLLHHSLEVGLFALQLADRVLLNIASATERREMEPRWQLAVFLAALCHDTGKPVSDYAVSDNNRETVWKPIKEDLYTWAQNNAINAYFIDWRKNRGRQHTALANLISDRIIGIDTFNWIEESGVDLIIWLMESLNNNPHPANPIHDLVIKADQLSVERDIESMGSTMAGYELGVPVERVLIDIMQRFVREGVWLINTPGARVWNISGDVYLVWPMAGEELARQIREDKIPGISRTPDGILDMLVERGIVTTRENNSTENYFWKISPKVLTDKIPDIQLQAVRLVNDTMVSSTPMPAVEGMVIDGKQCAEKHNVVESLEKAEYPEPGSESEQETKIKAQPQIPIRYATETPIATKPELRAQATSKLPVTQTDVIPDDTTGSLLKKLAQDLKTGKKRWGNDAWFDAEGRLLIRWPDAINDYELAVIKIIEEFYKRQWLWIDPMAPLKKVIDTQINGQPVKAIRLQREISVAFNHELGDVPTVKQTEASVPGEKKIAVNLDTGATTDNHNQDTKKIIGKSVTKKLSAKQRKSINRSAVPEKSQSEKAEKLDKSNAANRPRYPTLDELVSIIQSIGAAEYHPDGFVSVEKNALIEACKERGFKMTHSFIANSSRHDAGKIYVENGAVKLRNDSCND